MIKSKEPTVRFQVRPAWSKLQEWRWVQTEAWSRIWAGKKKILQMFYNQTKIQLSEVIPRFLSFCVGEMVELTSLGKGGSWLEFAKKKASDEMPSCSMQVAVKKIYSKNNLPWFQHCFFFFLLKEHAKEYVTQTVFRVMFLLRRAVIYFWIIGLTQ